ncbi:MAG: hypothetical protein OHK0028_05050 [Deltaproteobacteria bacterium]
MTPARRAVALLGAALLSGCGYVSRGPTPGDRLEGFQLLAPVRGTVSSPFGDRAGGRHTGVDILAPDGTRILAAESGVVAYAGNGYRGYGNAVIVDHGGAVTTLYGHLGTIRVRSGDAVEAGDVIGTVGRSGNATTHHLHFELRVDGNPVDPLPHMTR